MREELGVGRSWKEEWVREDWLVMSDEGVSGERERERSLVWFGRESFAPTQRVGRVESGGKANAAEEGALARPDSSFTVVQ